MMRVLTVALLSLGASLVVPPHLPRPPSRTLAMQSRINLSLGRRQILGAAILCLPATTPARVGAERRLPPAEMILDVAENTDAMEGLMRESAREAKAGRQPEIKRGDMVKSVNVMLTNSELSSIGADEAARDLRRIADIARARSGPLRSDEFLSMAKAYSDARSDLRRSFEALPRKEQMAGKANARKKRAAEETKLVAARLADTRRRAADEPAAVRAVILDVAESIDAMEVRRILVCVFRRDERDETARARAKI